MMKNNYNLNQHEKKEMEKIFLENTQSIITTIRQLLNNLYKSNDQKSILIEIKRHFHTLCGDASIMKYTYISTLTRKIEELINKTIFLNNHLTNNTVSIVNECIDIVEALAKSLEKDGKALSEWAKFYKKIEKNS